MLIAAVFMATVLFILSPVLVGKMNDIVALGILIVVGMSSYTVASLVLLRGQVKSLLKRRKA